jgi:protein pelota
LCVILQRRAYARLVDGVKEAGGEAFIFSGAHVSGEQLDQLTGVAAILRFPLPDLEDQELDAEDL